MKNQHHLHFFCVKKKSPTTKHSNFFKKTHNKTLKMNWLKTFFTSTIGRKFIMALTGLFLCTFLIVHFIGNALMYLPDQGATFNQYAYFMTHNPLIRTLEIGLFAGFIFHVIDAFLIIQKNRTTRPVPYANGATKKATWHSRNMGVLGSIILIFLILHLKDFWFEMHFSDEMPTVQHNGHTMKNLYAEVKTAFANPLYAIVYILAMVAMCYHLLHGFQSAFQTLGLNSKKYTPFIKAVGVAFAVLISAGFASFPILFLLGIVQ